MIRNTRVFRVFFFALYRKWRSKIKIDDRLSEIVEKQYAFFCCVVLFDVHFEKIAVKMKFNQTNTWKVLTFPD